MPSFSKVRTPHQKPRRHPQSPRPTPLKQKRRIPLPTPRPHPARRRTPHDPPSSTTPEDANSHQSITFPPNAQEAQTKADGLSPAGSEHRLGRRRLGLETCLAASRCCFFLLVGSVVFAGLLGGAGEGFAGCGGSEWVCCCVDGTCDGDDARLCRLIDRLCTVPVHERFRTAVGLWIVALGLESNRRREYEHSTVITSSSCATPVPWVFGIAVVGQWTVFSRIN